MKAIKLLFAAAVAVLAFSAFTNPANGGGDTEGIAVSTVASQIIWKGYKVTGEHTGNIELKSGALDYTDGVLTGGQFVIDMSSISCTDLTGEYADKLVGHLKSADFFGVDKFPTATLNLTQVIPNGVDRYKVTADLTIKETTKPVKFIATVTEKDGKKVAVADIQVDRSEYNVRYGSGSFFDNLGDKTIYDEFDLSVRLVTE